MGSEATLDDFEGFFGRVLDYNWKLLEKKDFSVADTIQPKLYTDHTAGYRRVANQKLFRSRGDIRLGRTSLQKSHSLYRQRDILCAFS